MSKAPELATGVPMGPCTRTEGSPGRTRAVGLLSCTCQNLCSSVLARPPPCWLARGGSSCSALRVLSLVLSGGLAGEVLGCISFSPQEAKSENIHSQPHRCWWPPLCPSPPISLCPSSDSPHGFQIHSGSCFWLPLKGPCKC